MKIEDMNEGVRILIERIKTNPEEFSFGVNEKWADIIREICKRVKGEPNLVPFLYDEEAKAVYDELREAERQEFTAHVIRKLAGTPKEDWNEQLELPYARGLPSTNKNSLALTKVELDKAKRLGVSPEVFATAKSNEKRKKELIRALSGHII